MRITGGQAKGRLLAPLKGMHIRPTADQIRETIFNIIGQDLRGLKVLDLFAGTGSLGLEALSRGAQHVIFIDKSRQALNLIRRNLAICGFENSGSVLRRDLCRGIPWDNPLMKDAMDLVFLDPPYGKKAIPPLIEELSSKDVLSSGSLVVAESAKKEKLPVSLGEFHMVDTRVYGDTRISLYAYEVRK
ncbi:MAG: 16S rRNA (guanine(966)-N(2))-methyltransferase RsmD [Deltaproteobacteria bacterium]|nr:16S rRNA (guanine(966)-N(2))-methyltransferase RsmD [Deltaproteobacteria bacterium]